MSRYRYIESGLDNVWIEGVEPRIDEDGDEVVEIPNVEGLHRLLAALILDRPHGISPQELRFLRTEMGMTQGELAALVKKDHQTVGRWERGETPIEQNAEFVIRSVARERLGAGSRVSAETLASWCAPTRKPSPLVVDGRNPPSWRPLKAA